MAQSKIFHDYMSLCNMVLRTNRGIFPYDKIFEAANESIDKAGGHMHVTVVDQVMHTEIIYEVRHNDDGYYATEVRSKISCGGEGRPECSGCSNNCGEKKDGWRISMDYLKTVMKRPEYYMQNPALMDWGWLMVGVI